MSPHTANALNFPQFPRPHQLSLARIRSPARIYTAHTHTLNNRALTAKISPARMHNLLASIKFPASSAQRRQSLKENERDAREQNRRANERPFEFHYAPEEKGRRGNRTIAAAATVYSVFPNTALSIDSQAVVRAR